jgi:hypothetical protein
VHVSQGESGHVGVTVRLALGEHQVERLDVLLAGELGGTLESGHLEILGAGGLGPEYASWMARASSHKSFRIALATHRSACACL